MASETKSILCEFFLDYSREFLCLLDYSSGEIIESNPVAKSLLPESAGRTNFFSLQVQKQEARRISLQELQSDLQETGFARRSFSIQARDFSREEVLYDFIFRLVDHSGERYLLVIGERNSDLSEREKSILNEAEKNAGLLIDVMKDLERSYEKYRVLFNHTSDGIIIAKVNRETLDSMIVEVNQTAEELLLRTRNELIGMSLKEILQEKNTSSGMNLLEMGSTDGTARGGHVFLDANSNPIPVELSVSTFRYMGEVSFMVSFRDSTEKQKMEAERIKREQFFFQKSRLVLLGEMIGAISHQWRQPLSGLSLLIQDLEDAQEFNELDPEYLRSFVRSSMEQIQFMENTIEDFRSFFKTETKKRYFNAKEQIEKVVSLLSTQMAHRGIHTTVQSSSGLMAMIYGNTNEFRHLVMNLLSNSRKAIENRISENDSGLPGEVVIELRNEDSKLVVVFQDNGTGIPEELIPHIFDPYVTSDREHGTGMGLSMSRTIVQNLEGEITAANNDRGALITILLPLAQSESSYREP